MDSRFGPRWDGEQDDLRPVESAEDELALVGAALRQALVRPVDGPVADAHVRQMVAAHASGPARGDRPPRRQARTQLRHLDWQRRLVPLVSGVAAAGLAAAVVTGAFPAPVQSRLADAAAHLGLDLPGRRGGRTTRVSTPTPTTISPTTPSTTVTTPTSVATPTTLSPSTTLTTLAAAPAPSSAPTSTTATTAAREPATTAPPTTARAEPTTVPLSSTTSTTAPGDGCVNPVLISVTATLTDGGMAVAVVIQTSGTVPYMSATIAGMTGVVSNLQPTSFGFQGTVTAPTTIPAGSVLEIGSCGNQIRGKVVIQA